MLVPESIREFFRCRILRPLLRQLRGGVTPRRLAWSLALGIVIGINPSVGITTLLLVVLAWAFGLNQIASQIGSHAVAPLHLLLLSRSLNWAYISFTPAAFRSTGTRSSISVIILGGWFGTFGSGNGMH